VSSDAGSLAPLPPPLTFAEWVRDHVRDILREADSSAWRSERAEELRRRVRDVVARAKAYWDERARAQAMADVDDHLRGLLTAMERSLPDHSSRAEWAEFVGEVHPAYEALVAALPAQVAPAVRPTNYARSLFHLAAAAVALTAVALLPSRAWLIACPAAFAVYAWSMEIGRRVSPRLNDRLMRFYGPIAHPHERYRVNSATWYATALVALACFASRPAMIAAVVVLGVADPLAAIVGRRFGRHMLRSGRSLEGTLAFFASGTIAAAIALGIVAPAPVAMTIALAVAGALAGAIAELLTTKLDDNLTIPLTVGAVVTALATLMTSL
jgi:dolichol kinase